MAETTPHSKVIRQNDDGLPPHLNFNRLREEGLQHIGNLSGKIWTDHNTHDPGITTLEVLCYALLDLGYRSSLPIEDLLAQKDGLQDDNFFTPAEILSCNPLTVTDYRKLLLEIDGVRNAWLEPVEKRNPQLYLDTKTGQLCCCECDTEVSSPKTEHALTDNKVKDCGCKKSSDATACIDLNGLYHVYLELEKDLYEELEQEKEQEKKCWKECEQGQTDFDLEKCVTETRKKRTAFFKQVQCVLSAHRNLCEDFEDITILCPQKVGLCAEVEVLPGTDADKVYAEILRRLTDYISPTARFYSLQALLEKGSPIEEIFSGRPHSLKSVFEKGLQESGAADICAGLFDNTAEAVFQSFGFIDTEELESISLKKELHLSDLYSVIHSVEGVYSVKNLCVNSVKKGEQQGSDDPEYNCCDEGISQSKWRFQLFKDTVPVFVLDELVNGTPLTNIQFSTTTGVIPVNKKKVHAELTRYRKSRLSDEFLNTAIPSGILREDLADYISIQNDFPRVYGIGDTGLPESASLLRRTQALQFQGYLLFFDQLLADYLQQLNHLRDLFSLQQESLRPAAQRHTAYSAQLNPDLTPGLNKLLRLFAAKDQGIVEGAVMALPVFLDDDLENALCKIKATLNGKLVVSSPGACYEPEASNCDELIALAGFKRAFRRDSTANNIKRALDKKQYEIDIRQDNSGWFFMLRFSTVNNLVLIGTGRYKFEHEAESNARLTAFLGTWEQNLNKIRYENSSTWIYTFQIVSRSIDYALFLQNLAENETAYLKRRESFLDHLLSRFSEKFTEYAAMMFGQIQDEQARRRTSVEDKSRFLSNYDDISRNRGRAFDYLQPSWGTHNISGFERRAMSLAGFADDRRHSLCNVEVYEKKLPYEVVLNDWQGTSWLVSQDPIPAQSTGEKVAAALHQALKSETPFQIDFDSVKKYSLGIRAAYVQFQYPGKFGTYEEAEKKGKQIEALFAKKSGDDNIIINNIYTLALRNQKNEVIEEGKTQVDSRLEAESPERVNEFINTINRENNALKLIPLEGNKKAYLNIAEFKSSTEKYEGKYSWKLYDGVQKKYISSSTLFPNESAAITDLTATCADKNMLFKAGKGFKWEISLGAKIALHSNRIFADADKATTAWRQAKEWGINPKNYSAEGLESNRFRINLYNDKAGLIACTKELDADSNNPEALISACIRVFEQKKVKPKMATHDNCWGFNINNEKGEALLSSYGLYATNDDALDAFKEAHKVGVIADRYVKSGDATNLNYIFLLKDQLNNFIAEVPQAFDTPSERDKALQAMLKALKKHPEPWATNQELPTYIFRQFTPQNTPLLTAADEYPSEEAAFQAFLIFLNQIADPSAKQTVAIKPENGSNLNQVMAQVAEMVQSQLFTLSIIERASGYRFCYYWISPDGQYEPLFESIQEFKAKNGQKDKDEVRQAYHSFVKDLHQAQLTLVSEGQNQWLTVSMPGKKMPIARTIRDKVVQQTDVQQFLDFTSTQLAEPVKSYSAWVHPSAGVQQYCFRLVKKGIPFAVLPCNTQLDNPDIIKDDITCYPPLKIEDKEAARNWFEPVPLPYRGDYHPRRASYTKEEAEKNRNDQCIKKPSDYTWLEVCYDVVQKPTGENCVCKYHFVIKGRIGGGSMSELFHSIKGYDTEALAIAAYQEQFLEILQVGSYEENYGPGKKICTKDCFKPRPDDCGKIGDFIAAIAPEFENDIPELVEWARSFPVRYFDVWENGHKTRKYYFRLFDKAADRFDWQSWACYDTFEKAWQGFRKLMQLLACDDNCRIGVIDSDCENPSTAGQKFQVEIREVLVTSQWPYASLDEAWGRDAHCDEPVPSSPCDPSPELHGDDCAHYGVERFLFAAQGDQAFYPFEETNPATNTLQYGFYVVDECYRVAVHPCWYDTEVEAQAALEGIKKPLLLEEIKREAYLLNGKYYVRLKYKKTDSPKPITQPCGCAEDEPESFECETLFTSTKSFDTEQESLKYAGTIFEIIEKIKTGDKRYEYRILSEKDCGPYSIELVDTCCILGKTPCLFEDKYSRDQSMALAKECTLAEGMHLLEHILLRPCVEDCAPKQTEDKPCRGEAQSIQPCNPCLLQGSPDTSCSLCWVDNPLEKDPCEKEANPPIIYYPLADMYSFWATLVLPAWMKRFHDEDARTFFQHVLYLEAPAHIALNIVWLSPRQLCKFEEVYQNWLTWMQCPVNGMDCRQMPGCCKEEHEVDEDRANGCNLRCCMVQTLTSLHPYSWCEPEPGEGEKDCGCGKHKVVDSPKHKAEEQPSLPEPTTSTVNINTAQRQFNNRMNERKSNTFALERQIGELQIYDRLANSFLSGDGNFSEFKKHLEFLLKNTPDLASGNLPEVVLLKNAIWHFLDKAINKEAEGNTFSNEKALSELLKKLTKRGFNLKWVIDHWDEDKKVSRVFGKKQVDRFIKMLKQ